MIVLSPSEVTILLRAIDGHVTEEEFSPLRAKLERNVGVRPMAPIRECSHSHTTGDPRRCSRCGAAV